jgi:hypothetical protein
MKYLNQEPDLVVPTSNPLTGSSYSLMSISKSHLAPIHTCMYYRYLESRKPSISVILYGCFDYVS